MCTLYHTSHSFVAFKVPHAPFEDKAVFEGVGQVRHPVENAIKGRKGVLLICKHDDGQPLDLCAALPLLICPHVKKPLRHVAENAHLNGTVSLYVNGPLTLIIVPT